MMILYTETATTCCLANTRWQANIVCLSNVRLLMYGKGNSITYSCFPFLLLGWYTWDLARQEERSQDLQGKKKDPRKQHTLPRSLPQYLAHITLSSWYCPLGWGVLGKHNITLPLINGKTGFWKQVVRSSLQICPRSCTLPHSPPHKRQEVHGLKETLQV